MTKNKIDNRCDHVVLHLSNTDVQVDSRILKELDAISDLDLVSVHALGVSDKISCNEIKLGKTYCHSIRLVSKKLWWFPRPVKYFFELVEFTIKSVINGLSIKPIVVHCHDTFPLPSGWILKKLLRCKLVYDAHELESNKNGQNILLSKATLVIEKLCWAKVDILVSVSDAIIEWYMRNLGVKPSVLVLNSPVLVADGCDRSDNHASDNYLRRIFDIPAEHLVFVYLGILGVGRGIEICLNAFSVGPRSVHVVFVGFGDLEGEIVRFAESNENIHFHAAVPHNEVVSFVSGADYGLCLVENVSLSDYYCLPNKLFEYGFSRLTVLASDFPEISRVVRQYSLGVCCVPTSESISRTLNELVGHRPVRPSADLTELSWDTQARRLKAAYQNLLQV